MEPHDARLEVRVAVVKRNLQSRVVTRHLQSQKDARAPGILHDGEQVSTSGCSGPEVRRDGELSQERPGYQVARERGHVGALTEVERRLGDRAGRQRQPRGEGTAQEAQQVDLGDISIKRPCEHNKSADITSLKWKTEMQIKRSNDANYLSPAYFSSLFSVEINAFRLMIGSLAFFINASILRKPTSPNLQGL